MKPQKYQNRTCLFRKILRAFVNGSCGLVIISLFVSSILHLPMFSNSSLTNNLHVSAAEQYNINLPQLMRSPTFPTVFGAALSLTYPKTIDLMATAGNYWVRNDSVAWSNIEPTPGSYGWSSLGSLETEMINARQRGMEKIIVVNSTPDWAQKVSGYSCGPIKESEFPAFANFMFELVSRYSQHPYNVKYWEIWNEPDIDPSLVAPDSGFGCWGDKTDPYYGGGYYAEMLKSVYPQIKHADPQAKVLIGGILLDCDPRTSGLCTGQDGSIPPRFLKGILCRNGANDGGNYFDGVSYHAYDFYQAFGHYNNPGWNSSSDTTGPVVIAKAEFIKQVLNTYDVTGKFLMNTESAIICGCPNDPPGGPGCESAPDSPFEQTKANYVTQVYASAIAEGLSANIWYHVFGWRNSALLNSDFSPRPAYYAFTTAHKVLQDSHLLREIDDFPSVKGYEYIHSQHRVWVLWSLDGNNHSVNLDSLPKKIYDTLGNTLIISNPLQVGIDPLYLDWYP